MTDPRIERIRSDLAAGFTGIGSEDAAYLLSELDRWEKIAERIEQLQLDPIHRPDGFTVLTAVRGLIRRSSQQPAAGSPEGSDRNG